MLVYEAAPGPPISFQLPHLLRALLIIGKEGTIGRKSLSQRLKIGEGVVRTLIGRLRTHQLVSCDKMGCKLTRKGQKVYLELLKKISYPKVIEAGRLSLGKWNVALLVRKTTKDIGHGLKQRDAALLVGASGANTIIYRDGKFVMPAGSSDCAKDYPDPVWGKLESELRPEDGDVIILCGGETHQKAENGALAAAWTLIDV